MMFIRIICDFVVWWVATWFAVLLRFGSGDEPEFFQINFIGFLLPGLLWIGCRAFAYNFAAVRQRRIISVILTALCPLSVIAFCAAVSYMVPAVFVWRGVMLLQLMLAGWFWGMLSELIFNPVRGIAVSPASRKLTSE
jgi:FlaA1/EpsC-like NDP-sugar epimerase